MNPNKLRSQYNPTDRDSERYHDIMTTIIDGNTIVDDHPIDIANAIVTYIISNPRDTVIINTIPEHKHLIVDAIYAMGGRLFGGTYIINGLDHLDDNPQEYIIKFVKYPTYLKEIVKINNVTQLVDTFGVVKRGISKCQFRTHNFITCLDIVLHGDMQYKVKPGTLDYSNWGDDDRYTT